MTFQVHTRIVHDQVTISVNSFLVVNLVFDTCFLNHRGSQLVGKSPEEVYEKAAADENRDA